ncbi:MAG: hypothetical protein NW202_13380 [Nitrospira sp.]|nr:hypothetical protein [Nitrospira sp.]
MELEKQFSANQIAKLVSAAAVESLGLEEEPDDVEVIFEMHLCGSGSSFIGCRVIFPGEPE